MVFNLQKIENDIEVTDLEEFLGVLMVMNERSAKSCETLPRYYVIINNLEIKEGRGSLLSSAGNGDTMDEALSNYANILSNKDIVINAYTNNRKEFTLPKIVHTKLLNK